MLLGDELMIAFVKYLHNKMIKDSVTFSKSDIFTFLML